MYQHPNGKNWTRKLSILKRQIKFDCNIFYNSDCQREVENMKEQISMFIEMIAAKDEIVVSMTNRVSQKLCLSVIQQLIFEWM